MSEHPAWTLRVHADGAQCATTYVRRHRFDVGLPLQFDEEYEHVTALEYVLGAIAADLVVGFRRLAKKRRLDVDHVEALVRGRVDNPLTFLPVVGEEGHPGLTEISVKVYVGSIDPPDTVSAVWEEAIRTSPLANTFRGALRLHLEHEVVI